MHQSTFLQCLEYFKCYQQEIYQYKTLLKLLTSNKLHLWLTFKSSCHPIATCPDAHRLHDTGRAFPHAQTEQGALSRKPGWGCFCVRGALKEKRKMGVRFGIHQVKGVLNYPSFSTSECLMTATGTPLSQGFGAVAKKYGMEESHPCSPGCMSKHALSTDPTNHLC